MTPDVLSNYEIHRGTMAVLSASAIEFSSIALEVDGKLHIRKPPLQLIKEACLDGGSTYDGRRIAVTYLTGAQNKVPIPIHPMEQIYAFPTHSPQLHECHWLFYHHVLSIKPAPKSPSQSIVRFKNYPDPLKLDVSYNTLDKQMQRTSFCIVRFSPVYTHSVRMWDRWL
ncbi:competence protein ComK [Camelliibacillus cellulosilyticus]|uniref:Competence protein ComK n=1 Tax=Camelliibacillus cellulosilyticus TaxID=2174486 RepID=A0ABV9GUB4_9BACL